jgi:2'-5' RNA ligase
MTERVIVVFPRFANPEPIHRLRSRFDPLAREIEPHLTLVFPFRSELSAPELERHIARAVKGMQPFSLLLREITGHDWEYLFLNVKQGNDGLIELHDRLYTGPLKQHLRRDHTFLPHLTVGRVRNPATFHEALKVAASVREGFETTVNEVVTYTIGDDGRRGVELTVPLAG